MTEEQKETIRFYTTNDYLLINGLLWGEKDEIINEFITLINNDGRAVMKEAEEAGFDARWDCSIEEGKKLYEIYKKRFPFTINEETRKQIIDRAKQDIKNLTDCLKPLPNDTVLYRNTKAKYFATIKEGDVFNCLGFSSCSLTPHNAENLMYGTNSDIMLKINAPKGTLAIKMDEYLDIANEPDEVILPPTKFLIANIDKDQRLIHAICK